MDFELSKKHEAVRRRFRAFAEREVRPLASEIDEEERFPHETIGKLVKRGFLGLSLPKEYGGRGGDTLAFALLIEELSRVCASTGVIVSTHISLACEPVREHGTEEQKRRYLVPMAKGEKLGAFGLTEPEAGTDVVGLRTTAVPEGDVFLLNGSKIFITNGGVADIYIIFAVTDASKGNKGISAFIVEKGLHGFSIGRKERKMGI
jgi:butyryl-CoA dehydrogenase